MSVQVALIWADPILRRVEFHEWHFLFLDDDETPELTAAFSAALDQLRDAWEDFQSARGFDAANACRLRIRRAWLRLRHLAPDGGLGHEPRHFAADRGAIESARIRFGRPRGAGSGRTAPARAR